ncbi:aspartate-semialdehyde dehydrogenase, partial [Dehalococcoidia bacterium]|nr:aspartate-semialdehyde dehydrogenase [Dehalococcoidia bacterium]
MKNFRVAILGATGLVGQEFIKVLKQRNFPMDSLVLLASGASAGKQVIVDGDEIEVQEATPRLLENVDLALFSAGSEISRVFAPEAARAGAVVVDNSAAFRMEPGIPL